MATPTNTLLTTGGSAVIGMREDLSDKITMLDKAETPLFSWMGTTTAKNSTAHDWEDQRLRAPAKNAKPEGDVFAPTAPVRPIRLSNACQISTEVASVSGTSEAVDVAGNAGDLDYQLLVKGKELKRDIEKFTILANQVKKITDPREAAGILTFAGVAETGAGGTEPTGDGATVVVRGTGRALTTTLLDNILQEMSEEGAEPAVAFMVGRVKRVFDALSADNNLAQNQIVLGNGRDVGITFVNTVTLYKSTFGTIAFVLNKHMSGATADQGDILIFDGREEFRPKKAVLPGRSFVRGNPQLNHDGRSQAVIWEGTVEVPAPKAVGLLTGLQ